MSIRTFEMVEVQGERFLKVEALIPVKPADKIKPSASGKEANVAYLAEKFSMPNMGMCRVAITVGKSLK